jgi:hypothetical protein
MARPSINKAPTTVWRQLTRPVHNGLSHPGLYRDHKNIPTIINLFFIIPEN